MAGAGAPDASGNGAEGRQMDRKHVFAINHAPEFLDVVRTLLQDEEYKVTTTNFVPRTFDQIAALEPDLLLIDLATSEQAGWDLLERLHTEAATRRIPVLVTSTDLRLLDRVQADVQRYGGQQFMAKPMDRDDLLESIRVLVGTA